MFDVKQIISLIPQEDLRELFHEKAQKKHNQKIDTIQSQTQNNINSIKE